MERTKQMSVEEIATQFFTEHDNGVALIDNLFRVGKITGDEYEAKLKKYWYEDLSDFTNQIEALITERERLARIDEFWIGQLDKGYDREMQEAWLGCGLGRESMLDRLIELQQLTKEAE